MKSLHIACLRTCAILIGLALSACNGQGGSNSAIPQTVNPLDAGTSGNSTAANNSDSVSAQASLTQSAPTHISTWAYDEYSAQGESATSAQVQQYVTYAEGGYGNAKASSDCGTSGRCYSVWYLESNFIYGSTLCPDSQSAPLIKAASEDWFVHLTGYTDSAHRVHGTYSTSCSKGSQSAPVWVSNGSIAGVQNYYKTYLQEYANAWNYIFIDDTSGTVVDQMYGPGGGFCNGSLCTSTQEMPTNASVVNSHAAFANAINHTNGSAMQFFYNSLTYDGAQVANDLNLMQSTSRFVGGVCENCIVNANAFRTNMYVPVLNTMAAVDAASNGSFVLLSTGNASAGSSQQISERLVTTAIIWLGYQQGKTIVWPDLEYNTSNLAVWPEDNIYPSQPVQSMTTGATNIQVATNVWRREFAACNNAGTSIGACAAIVNGGSGAVVVQKTWLQKTYTHSVELAGGDALHGGSVSLTSTKFTAGTTTIPAGQALLLVP